MKRLVAIYLSAISLLLPITSEAVDWVRINSETDPGMFVDSSTIKIVGKKVRVWTYANHEWEGSRSQRHYLEYDCEEEKVRFLTSAGFSEPDLKGIQTYGPDLEKPWTYIPPGTMFEAIMRAVCPEQIENTSEK